MQKASGEQTNRTHLSPVKTHILIPAAMRSEIVSETPACSLSSIALAPRSCFAVGGGGRRTSEKALLSYIVVERLYQFFRGLVSRHPVGVSIDLGCGNKPLSVL